MALKTYTDLVDELNAAVRSDGLNGKTTAEDVRTFLTSFIKELTTQTALPVDIKLEDTATIDLTQDSITKAIKADLIFSGTPEINLKVDLAGLGGLQGELTPSIRNSLLIYIDDANDNRFLFYSGGKTYAFVSAGKAVGYVQTRGMTGLFVFRADVSEPLELLHNCTYDMTGFDSVITSGSGPNFKTRSSVGGCQTSLKIRRIINNSDAPGETVAISGRATEAQIDGDIILDNSSGKAAGITITKGAKLRYRGNIEARKNATFIVQQGESGYEGDCITDFKGNILTQADMNGTSIWCNGGMFTFTGRIDMLGPGVIAQYRVLSNAISLMRLNLLGATSKGSGIWILVYSTSATSARFEINGVIDTRESKLGSPREACGLLYGASQLPPVSIDVQFENLTILTKKGIKPVYYDIPIVNKIAVIGNFTTTEDPSITNLTFEKVTPFHVF